MSEIGLEAGLGHVDPVHAVVGGSRQAFAGDTFTPGGTGRTTVVILGTAYSHLVGGTPTVGVSARPNFSTSVRILSGIVVSCPRKFARRALHVVALITVLCYRTGVAYVLFGLAVAPSASRTIRWVPGPIQITPAIWIRRASNVSTSRHIFIGGSIPPPLRVIPCTWLSLISTSIIGF